MTTATRTAGRNGTARPHRKRRPAAPPIPPRPVPPDALGGIVGADLTALMRGEVDGFLHCNLDGWESYVRDGDWYDLTLRLAGALVLSAGMLALQDRVKAEGGGEDD